MKRVTRSDILPLETYESRRAGVRKRILALKGRRRLILAPHLSLVFENHDTVWYQIQEMLRAERIVKARAIRHEIDTYNELIPPAGALSATLFIEIPGLHHMKEALARFAGLPKKGQLWLRAGGERCFPTFDEDQYSKGRIAAVQYLVFELGAAARAALRDPKSPVEIECAHPANPCRVEVAAELRRELLADLRPARPRRR